MFICNLLNIFFKRFFFIFTDFLAFKSFNSSCISSDISYRNFTFSPIDLSTSSTRFFFPHLIQELVILLAVHQLVGLILIQIFELQHQLMIHYLIPNFNIYHPWFWCCNTSNLIDRHLLPININFNKVKHCCICSSVLNDDNSLKTSIALFILRLCDFSSNIYSPILIP